MGDDNPTNPWVIALTAGVSILGPYLISRLPTASVGQAVLFGSAIVLSLVVVLMILRGYDRLQKRNISTETRLSSLEKAFDDIQRIASEKKIGKMEEQIFKLQNDMHFQYGYKEGHRDGKHGK